MVEEPQGKTTRHDAHRRWMVGARDRLNGFLFSELPISLVGEPRLRIAGKIMELLDAVWDTYVVGDPVSPPSMREALSLLVKALRSSKGWEEVNRACASAENALAMAEDKPEVQTESKGGP